MNATRENILIGDSSELRQHVDPGAFSKIFILCDSNTEKLCLPHFERHTSIEGHYMSMLSGEKHKNLATCKRIWSELLENGADRKSLLIILGGGVDGDLGAFCASTFMRGIAHIQVPTSLLAMVDASVGGKSGIDFEFYKNMIGTFTRPEFVLIDPSYLLTLPARHLNNGFVEVLKHALIADGIFWDWLKDYNRYESKSAGEMIERSVDIKHNIVTSDPFESGQRKALNFGHTIGHAFEELALSHNKDVLHGEAVAFGMMAAARVSVNKAGLSRQELKDIDRVLKPFCPTVPERDEVDEISRNVFADKKNIKGELRFSLLESIGACRIDVPVDITLVKNAILQTIEAVKSTS